MKRMRKRRSPSSRCSTSRKSGSGAATSCSAIGRSILTDVFSPRSFTSTPSTSDIPEIAIYDGSSTTPTFGVTRGICSTYPASPRP